MMIDEVATCTPSGNTPGSGTVLLRDTPAQGDRLEWLFREALRRQHVHPLMELLRRYRSQEGA